MTREQLIEKALRELLLVLPEYMGYAVYLKPERDGFFGAEDRVARAMRQARSILVEAE